MAKKPKFANGKFEPKNPSKYIGTFPIVYRSSWELVFMNFCDNHDGIRQWASESIKIPYTNPLTGKATIYVPDFLINYHDKTGQQIVELIEIKPVKQSLMEKARGQQAKMIVAVNKAKWKAAAIWCKKHGMRFRVMTEADMFAQTGKV